MVLVLSLFSSYKNLFVIGFLVSLLLTIQPVNELYAEESSNTVPIITPREETFLLDLARFAIEQYLDTGEYVDVAKETLSPRLTAIHPVFVTLTKKETGLRGCIGSIQPGRPLYIDVIVNAINAATGDPRFPKVTSDELPSINIEITINSPPADLPFDSWQDLLEKIKPGRDGVILITSYGQSTYLSQVWEQLPGKVEFFNRLSRKHGAPVDQWKKPGTRVKTYHALKLIHESDISRRIVTRNGAVVGRMGAVLIGSLKSAPHRAVFGGYFVKEGTVLAPGCIVWTASDIKTR